MAKKQNAVITDPAAQRVCRLSGLQKQLITLRDVERSLQLSIRDVEQAIKDEYFWRAMELATKVIQVSCDVVIVAVESVPGIGTSAKGVSAGYDVAKLVVDAFNSELTLDKAFIYSMKAKIGALTYHLDNTGKRRYAKLIERTSALADVTYDLYGYWKTRGKVLTTPSGLVSARRTAVSMLQRIRQQIIDVQGALDACNAEPSALRGRP